MGFSRQEDWVGCHALLQEIFPTQGLNPRLLHLLCWQLGSLPLPPPAKPVKLIYKPSWPALDFLGLLYPHQGLPWWLRWYGICLKLMIDDFELQCFDPGSMGLQRVRRDWVTHTFTLTLTHSEPLGPPLLRGRAHLSCHKCISVCLDLYFAFGSSMPACSHP